MKNRLINVLWVATLGTWVGQLSAADVYKADNVTNLNNAGAWVGGVLPGVNDTVIWDNRITGTNGSVQSGGVTFGQIKILDPSNADIRNGTVVLNGVSVGGTNIGIDMSAATSDLTFYGTVQANAAQTWVLGNGMTLAFRSYNGNTDDALNNVNLVTVTGLGNFVYGPRNGNSRITIANNWDFTGSFTVFGGGVILGNNGNLSNLTELILGGIFTIDAGAANRINSAAVLTLGERDNGGATLTVNANQTFDRLQVVNGYSRVLGSGTVTISDGYKRPGAGYLKVEDGSKFVFANAPSAANGDAVIGSGGNEILLGAAMGNSDDFIKAAAGVVTKANYSDNVWGAGLNTNLTAATTLTSGTVTQSLRFGANSPHLTINTGTLELESGMILVYNGANINGVNGGSIIAGAGHSLMWIGESGRNTTISANLLDNGNAVALEKYGGGSLGLSGSNTFTGEIYLHGGALIVNNQYALGVGNANINVVSGNSTLTMGADNLDIQRNILIQRTEGTFSVNLNNGVAKTTLSGDITGVGNNRQVFAKSGTGTLWLTGKLTDAASAFQINGSGEVVLTGTVDNSSLNYALGFDIRSTGTGTAVFTMKDDAVILRPGSNIYSNSDGSTLIMNIEDRAYLYSSSAFSIGNNANANDNRKVVLNITESGSMVTNGGVNINNAVSAVTEVNLSGSSLFQANGDLSTNGLNNFSSSGNARLTINVAESATMSVSRFYLGKGIDTITTLNQSGGLVKAALFALNGDTFSNNTNTYNFNGGVLEVNSANNPVIILGAGSTLNLNGGTIKVLSNNSRMSAANKTSTIGLVSQGNIGTTTASGTAGLGDTGWYIGKAVVQAGGVTFDTGTNNFSVEVPLLHDDALGSDKDGGIVKTGLGIMTMTGSSSTSNTWTVNAGSTNINGVNVTNVAGTYTDNTARAGSWGVNTYTGDTVIKQGTIKANMASIAGVGGAFGKDSVIVFGNDYTEGEGYLDLNGFDQQIGGLSGGENYAGYVQNNTGSAVLTINSSGSTRFDGSIFGSNLSVVKTGTGTQTLTGEANTYGGSTTVNQGTLLIAGDGKLFNSTVTINGGVFDYASSVALDRDVIVDGGVFKYNSAAVYSGNLTFTSGVIGGNGNFTSALSIGAGQVIAPGNSAGNFKTGAQTWLTGGAYEWEISAMSGAAGTDWDLLTISGVLNLEGIDANGFSLLLSSLTDLSGFDSSQAYAWEIATASGGIVGFDVGKFLIDADGLSGFDPAGFSLYLDSSSLFLKYEMIPEPSTWGLLLAGAAMLTVGVLRRRKSTVKC